MSQRVPHDGCRAVDFATADNVSAPTISINAMTNATIFLTFILTFLSAVGASIMLALC